MTFGSSAGRHCNFSVRLGRRALAVQERRARGRKAKPVQSLPTLVRGRVGGGRGEPVLLERYRVLERLGAGGFGVVWRAYDEREQCEVAVKRIPVGPDADAARAAREALAVGRLSHPAIVRLREARSADDGFYLVSELVRGPTLAQLFERGLEDDQRLFAIIQSVARALAHAHRRGVIHRDVKPPNILVAEGEHAEAVAAKLTDFGGAQLAGEDALTRTGDVVGTLAYMAPEQADGRGAGPSSDLYSLALVLYEGLTGANPVRGVGPADTARRLGRPLPSLGDRRPDLPPRLIAAIDAALDPRPAQRGGLEDLIAVLATATSHRRPRRIARAARPRVGGSRRLVGPEPRPPAPAPGARAAFSAHPRLPRAPRVAGALAAGLLMTAALRLLLLDPSYAPLGGALAVLIVALAPRLGWLAGSAFVVIWLIATGSGGAGLVVASAVLPVAVALRRPGPAWSAPALAPLAGFAGLAAAFPALAGQAGGWPRRAAVGGLGFWWLMLGQALAGRRLWLGPPPGTLAPTAWQHSFTAALNHALVPLLVPGTLGGVVLWAAAAVALPWLVRGRNAARDLAAAGLWGVLLSAVNVALEQSLVPAGGAAWPRGMPLGTALGVLVAVGWRALRGPGTRAERMPAAPWAPAVDGGAPV